MPESHFVYGWSAAVSLKSAEVKFVHKAAPRVTKKKKKKKPRKTPALSSYAHVLPDVSTASLLGFAWTFLPF